MTKQRVDTELLDEIQRRVLWLAVRMVDFANRERAEKDDVKVGGHQASSASLTSIMTALYFDHLAGPDRVSVKPHASPVFHAISSAGFYGSLFAWWTLQTVSAPKKMT